MPKLVNVDADAEPRGDPSPMETLEAELTAAQEVFDKLIATRQKQRSTLSKDQFRTYNADTHDLQLETQARLTNAERKVSRALGRGEQRVKVETAREVSK